MSDATYKNYSQYFDLEKIIGKIKKYLKNFDEELFLKAFEFAEKSHRGQFRKDGVTPYLIHPVNTVEILTHLRADEDVLISALLHDVPEDTKINISELKNVFGAKVAFLVDGITKLAKVHYQHNMPERQIESLKKLLLHTAKDPRVIIIKLADRLHNMRTLKYIDKPEKRLRIARETLEIYVPIANLLGIQDLKTKLENWCFRYLFPTEYFKLKEKVAVYDQQNKEAMEKFIVEVSNILAKQNIKATIQARKKSLYSVYKKICALGKTIDDLDDRIGIRIIVHDIPQCYQILGIVHMSFVPKPQRFKDYIASPKINGYQSLHTCVFGVNGVVTEVQIRTRQMHLEAEYGIAAHFFYKEATKNAGSSLFITNDKRSSWVRKILAMEKAQKSDSDDFIENLKLDVFQDRIFVFTPKGATIDLPQNATAIDFAYAIHTEIGHHAQKVEINNAVKPITTTLKTGDVIKIITTKENVPELYWLSFARTNLARNKIRAYLRKIGKKRKIKDGKRMLQKEFDIAGLGLFEDINFKRIKIAVNKFLGKNYHNVNDLLISIGEGVIKPSNVVKAIKKIPRYSKFSRLNFLKYLWKKRTAIEGFIVNLNIITESRVGVLKEIMDVLYKNSLRIISIKGKSDPEIQFDRFLVQIIVDDMEKVSRIFDELEQLPGVLSIQRILYRAYFYFVLFLTLFLWLAYPLLVHYLNEFEFLHNYYWIINLLLYGGFITLVFIIIYMMKIVKRSFPLVRHRNTMWIILFSILTVAVASLLFGLIHYEIHPSWFVIFGGILLMYIYLGLGYLKVRPKE